MEYFGSYNATNHPTTLALLYGDDQELYHMMQRSLLHTFPPPTRTKRTKTKTFGDTVSKWLTVASFVGLLLSVCSITVRSGHPIARSIRSMSIWQQLRSWSSATSNLFSKWGWKLQLTGDSMKKLEIKTSSNSHPDAKDHALTEAAISPPEKAPSFSSSQQQDEELGSQIVRNEEPVPELSASSSPSEMLSKLKERRKQYLSDSFLDMLDSSPKKSDQDLVSKQARPSVAVQESNSTEATARVPSTRQSTNTPTTTTRTSTKTAKSKLKPWERKKQQRDDL